jgi:Ribose/Galactose Isomerase
MLRLQTRHDLGRLVRNLHPVDHGPTTGQGIMMAANKVKGIRCGVCVDTFSARMIRQHNDANMLSIGVRVVGEGLALDIVDAFPTAQFEGGRHATRVETIGALEGSRRPLLLLWENMASFKIVAPASSG